MSKYVQSSIGDTFSSAKDHLRSGRTVLFTGTPCQIAGLKKYLNKDYDALYTQDIICHGVPSPWVWKKNLAPKRENGSIIQKVEFRNKSRGWRESGTLYSCVCGPDEISECIPNNDDSFYRAFINKLSMRPSCYSCGFKGADRASDITLADYWGVEKCFPEMDDDRGVSLIVCNNDKGSALLDSIKDKLVIKAADYSEAISGNPMAVRSAYRPCSRELFFKYLQKHSLDDTVGLFCSEDPDAIKKVQNMQDFEEVKKEKGNLHAILWRIKNGV